MWNKINGQKDFCAGIIYIVSGSIFYLLAQEYRMGSATNMGPGYFPAMLGILLVALGVGAVFQGIRAKEPDPIPTHKLEPLILILASIISFGLLIERAGLIIATFVCILLACFRRALTNPIEVFLTFAALTIFNYVVFIYAFDMVMPVFPWDN